jgi:hypothetical protein
MSKPQTFTMPTSQGEAVATKDSQGEAWEINHPWGSFRFYGNVAEAKQELEQRIKTFEAEEAASNV